jgi:ribosomal protein L7/L12
MKRAPTEQEIEKITDAIFLNDRVEAINLYISISECGLTEAQDFIKNLTAELRESNPEKFTRKKQGRRSWLPQ